MNTEETSVSKQCEEVRMAQQVQGGCQTFETATLRQWELKYEQETSVRSVWETVYQWVMQFYSAEIAQQQEPAASGQNSPQLQIRDLNALKGQGGKEVEVVGEFC